jgi:hypothetical protein
MVDCRRSLWGIAGCTVACFAAIFGSAMRSCGRSPIGMERMGASDQTIGLPEQSLREHR